MAKIPKPPDRRPGPSTGENVPSKRPAFISLLEAFFSKLSNDKKYRRLILGFGFALLLLHLLEFPHHTYDTTHDLSSHATFEYYAAKHFQFGTEVYQNVGPFGYVHYAYSYIGYLHWPKVILKTLCRLALVILIFWMLRGFPNPLLKFLWWASFFAFFPFGDQTQHDYLDVDENYAYLTVYLTALWLLQNRRDRIFQLLSIGVWFFLAFLSLTKHTCFVLACSIVAAVAGQNILRRNFVMAGLGAASFLVSLVIQWLLAGQRLENLPAFVRGIFAFSGGYNEAMAINEPMSFTVLGMIAVALLLARIIQNWWKEKQEWGRPAVEAFLLYVIWKHAFVRADSIHLIILFYAMMLSALPVFFYRNGDAPTQRRPTDEPSPCPANHPPSASALLSFFSPGPKLKAAWCAALVIFCCISTYFIIPDGGYKPARLWNNLKHNASWLISPLRRTHEMEELLRAAKESNALPQTKALAGQATIDFFGYKPGYILLNDLNYRSRPMPITFAAANPLLQRANERFYRDPKTAPEFVLCSLGGVDDRLFIQDDALAFRALLDNYRPALTENGMLLLQRREASEFITSRTEHLLAEETNSLGQALSVSALRDQVVWLEVKVEHNWAGKLMSFFYKTPPCYLGFQFSGEEQMRFGRFITSMGECGFTLNPFLGNTIDMSNFYDQNSQPRQFPRIVRFAIACDNKDTRFFKNNIQMRFYTFERPQP